MKVLRFLAILMISLTASAVTASAHSDAFKPAFTSSLMPAYLSVQSALAADDLAAAQSAARTLLASAKQGPEFAAFTKPVQAMISAPDIKAARTSFGAVSRELIALVQHVGTTGEQDLFVAHCPMAFGGKGGDWLQGDQKIANPYYGAMMLRCGTIKPQATKP